MFSLKYLQYTSCFTTGRRIHRFWTWKATGRPWSWPDLFKTETTSRQNSRCKVRQPAFLKNILPMDGQMICQECHHLLVLNFGHIYHSLAKTLIQILKTIQYRQAWRKRQHSSMMNTWKTPKRAVTVIIFASNANAFTATERTTMTWFEICDMFDN